MIENTKTNKEEKILSCPDRGASVYNVYLRTGDGYNITEKQYYDYGIIFPYAIIKKIDNKYRAFTRVRKYLDKRGYVLINLTMEHYYHNVDNTEVHLSRFIQEFNEEAYKLLVKDLGEEKDYYKSLKDNREFLSFEGKPYVEIDPYQENSEINRN